MKAIDVFALLFFIHLVESVSVLLPCRHVLTHYHRDLRVFKADILYTIRK